MNERIIKFRAWDGEKMNYDIAVGMHSKDTCKNPTCIQIEDGDCAALDQQPIAVMQYTGIDDKNCNPVYEGDILSGDYYPYLDDLITPNYVGFIEHENASYYEVLMCINSAKLGISHNHGEVFENANDKVVLGNIYQNPELLDKKDR